jgi:small subunit ribosomal protein S24e
MDIAIVKEQDMPLLGRRDVTARIAFQGATPGRAQLRGALAHKLHTKEALVVVRSISTTFGGQASTVEVSAYKDDAHLARFELEHIRKRHGEIAAEEKKEGDA